MHWGCQAGAPDDSNSGIEGAEERLRLYVDEAVDRLRREFLGQASQHQGTNKDHEGVQVELQEAPKPTGDEEPLKPVSSDHLDNHDAHGLSDSAWEASVFIGFDCLGVGESCMLFFLLLLNIGVQVAFCWIVVSDMLEVPVAAGELDGLLRFRASVGHKVDNADVVARRSLMSQVCADESKLHVSGAQLAMQNDLDEFRGKGLFLCLLALFCWGSSIISEVNATCRFASAIRERRGKETRIVAQADGEYVMESLSLRDVVKAHLLGVLPRLAMAGFLGVVGSLYLSRTTKLEDLLLNAMALAFIMDVDELLFAAFGPHRAKSLLTGLAPLHLTPARSPLCAPRGGSAGRVFRLLLVAAAIIVVHVYELRPLHHRMQQALDILCTGNIDFIYGVDPASGMVVAARSAPGNAWTEAECTVLQLAHPELREGPGWSPPKGACSGIDDMTQLRQSVREAPAVIRPSWATTLEDEAMRFQDTEFQYVKALSLANVLQASGKIPCTDLVTDAKNNSKLLVSLRDAVGNASVSSCLEVQDLCYKQEMTKLRALCPETCQCDFWLYSASGWFKSPAYGCPVQCEIRATAFEDMMAMSHVYPLYCLDMEDQPIFHWQRSDNKTPQGFFAIVDEDRNGNISDTEWLTAYLRYLDRDVPGMFTDDLAPRLIGHPDSAWKFIIGLFESVRSRANYYDNLIVNVQWVVELSNLGADATDQIVQYFLRDVYTDWINGIWVLATGIPHPRNLVWCKYLTSWELQLILGTDLCLRDFGASVRDLCPRSCGCEANMPGCPRSCPSLAAAEAGLLVVR